MPGAKRTTKSVSYAEHDDDDDFISKVDAKKSRNTKVNERPVELKPSRQPPRKRNEKLTKTEQADVDLAIKLSSEESVQLNEISIELPNLSNHKQEQNVSSNESKTTNEEIFLPKSKRMKREEEEQEEEEEVVIEEVKKNDESSSEEEIDEDEEIDEEEDEEEQEQSPPRKKTTRKSDESLKPIESTNRLVTRNQQKSSSNTILTTEQTKKKVNAPVGFPTSKINIPSFQPSRVGLSRRSGAIKPLHPNLNQRIVHE